MLLFPVIFVVILFRYPAGLLVYWITTNVWTIGQQYLIRRRLPPPARPPETSPSNGKPKRPLRAALAAAAGAAGVAGVDSAARGATSPTAAPPRPPRKKKKRSGRRR